MKRINDFVSIGTMGLALVWAGSCVSPYATRVSKEQEKQFSIVSKATPIDSVLSYTASDSTNNSADAASSTIKKKILSEREVSNLVDFVYNKTSLKRKIPSYFSKKFFEDVILVESSRNVFAESDAGARGLMQLMEKAWKQVERDDSLRYNSPIDPYDLAFDPEKNVENGIKYYLWINRFCSKQHPNWKELPTEEKINIINAAYNFGAPGFKKAGWDMDSTSTETRTHIAKLDSLAGI